MRKIFFIGCLLALLASCNDEPACTQQVAAGKISAVDQTQLQKDIVTLDNYLASKSIVATTDPSGLRYVITKAGDDTRPCLESQITIKYAGRFLDGTGFDAAVNPVSFKLNGLILGWQIGFPNFGKGTRATLYIPSGFGYGESGSGTRIPANSNLIFDIELIAF